MRHLESRVRAGQFGWRAILQDSAAPSLRRPGFEDEDDDESGSRECKEEILEAHRSGISIHWIAQIFRERNVDISMQHLMRAIRLFIAEGERAGSGSSAAQERHQGPSGAGEEKKTSVTYQISKQPSALVREEEFAKQLRLARYLAGTSLPPSRPLEPALKARAPKQSDPSESRILKPRQKRRDKGWGGGIGEGEAAGAAIGPA